MVEIRVIYEDRENLLEIIAKDDEGRVLSLNITKAKGGPYLNCALRATFMRHLENFIQESGGRVINIRK